MVMPVTGAEIVTVGIVATLITDLWLRLVQTLGFPPANWALVGRWLAGFFHGSFVQRELVVPKVPCEAAIGWAFHYAVGIAYAGLYIALMKFGFGSLPTLVSALVF